jgi:hypothetical protein
MYTLTGARYRKDRRDGRWEVADLSTVPVTTLTTTHGDVWLFITYPSVSEPKALRFDLVANWVSSLDAGKTVSEWLTGLGNRTLPFAEINPQFRPHYVRYAQAWHAGYNIEPIGRIGTPDKGGSKFDKEDLVVTREDLTPRQIADYALFSVNGLFHRTEWREDGVRIRGGNLSLRKANDNQIGLHSFRDVGKLQYVSITETMLSRQRPDAPLRKAVYVTLPETVDLNNKTALLVLGGYLQALGKGYTRVGERTYRIELGNLMLMERYFDSRTSLDLSSLGLSQNPANPSAVSRAELESDAVLIRYLTLEQSFFVVVDSPSMFQELIPLEGTGLPGRYYAHEAHNFPVMGAYGRMLEYHTIEEDGLWVVCAMDNLRHKYDFHTRKWRTKAVNDAGRYPAFPFVHAHAFSRLLGVEK